MAKVSGPSRPGDGDIGVDLRVQAALPHMSVAMRKIGRLIIEHPAAALELSITELAIRAGTSPATVTRFCRSVGYAGYPALRVGIAAELGRSSAHETWRSDIGRVFQPGDTSEVMLGALLAAHAVALESTAKRLDHDAARRVAQAVAACRHLDIYGIGGSAMIAKELQARLYRIGINAHAWTEVHDGLTSGAVLDTRSVAIAVSNTGRTAETIEMLALAKSAGALAVAITGNPGSPLASLADLHLIAFAPGDYLQPDDLSAKHAQLLAIDLLYLLVAQQDFARTTTKLAASAAAVSPHRRPLRGGQRSPMPRSTRQEGSVA
ncbi:MAG: MurR/RpiR family transcriptional regulator [Microbacteriaceae bacterium]|nr:MurR/RpiR family transcriptional regulator [Microbacteriaceae bacterium]MCL2795542.1 MurR/RpiR family transcriptional regulator [Microbacteriaceae bacterium]